MKTARVGHTCSLMTTSGEEREVIAVGGWNAGDGDLDSVEIFNTQSKVWRGGEGKSQSWTSKFG